MFSDCWEESTGLLLVRSWLVADKASFINLTLNLMAHSNSPVSHSLDEEAKQILKDFVEPAVTEQHIS